MKTLDIDTILSEIERVKSLMPFNPNAMADKRKHQALGWQDACDTLAETLKKLASGHRSKGDGKLYELASAETFTSPE